MEYMTRMSKFALGHGNLQSHLVRVFYVATEYKLCWHLLFLSQMLERDKAQKPQRLVQRHKKMVCKSKTQPFLSETSVFMYFEFISFPYLKSVLLKA